MLSSGPSSATACLITRHSTSLKVLSLTSIVLRTPLILTPGETTTKISPRIKLSREWKTSWTHAWCTNTLMETTGASAMPRNVSVKKWSVVLSTREATHFMRTTRSVWSRSSILSLWFRTSVLVDLSRQWTYLILRSGSSTSLDTTTSMWL